MEWQWPCFGENRAGESLESRPFCSHLQWVQIGQMEQLVPLLLLHRVQPEKRQMANEDDSSISKILQSRERDRQHLTIHLPQFQLSGILQKPRQFLVGRGEHTEARSGISQPSAARADRPLSLKQPNKIINQAHSSPKDMQKVAWFLLYVTHHPALQPADAISKGSLAALRHMLERSLQQGLEGGVVLLDGALVADGRGALFVVVLPPSPRAVTPEPVALLIVRCKHRAGLSEQPPCDKRSIRVGCLPSLPSSVVKNPASDSELLRLRLLLVSSAPLISIRSSDATMCWTRSLPRCFVRDDPDKQPALSNFHKIRHFGSG